MSQPPKRWSGTLAEYFDISPGALAKILASASNCLDANRHSYIFHLLGLWTHSVSDGIEQFCYVLLFSPHLIDLAQLRSIVIPAPG